MKFLEKFNINSESKSYIFGLIFSVVALFVVTGVIFLGLVANRLDIIMTQPAKETYTYFIALMDRILAILTIFAIIPITCYQVFSKSKSKIDKGVTLVASIILIAIIITFFGGEYYYLKKYQSGELSYSGMFCQPTVETKVFDKIIIHKGKQPPVMCIPPNQRPKKNKINISK